MKKIQNITFIVHSLSFLGFIAFLILNYFELYTLKPIELVVFLWGNLLSLIISIIFFSLYFFKKQKTNLNKSFIVISMIYSLVFIIIFTTDPYYLLESVL